MSKPKRSIAHIVPAPGPSKAWCVYWYSAEDPVGHPPGVDVLRTKKLAVDEAVEWAKEYVPSQVFIHSRTGQIVDERTYQDDPPEIPGSRAKGRK